MAALPSLFDTVEALARTRSLRTVALAKLLKEYRRHLVADGQTVRAEAVAMLLALVSQNHTRNELFGGDKANRDGRTRQLDAEWPKWLCVASKAPLSVCHRIVAIYNAGKFAGAGRHARKASWPKDQKPPPTAWDVTKSFCDVYELIRTEEPSDG